MTNNRWSALDDEQANKNKMEVKVWKYEFSHPGEREEFIEKWRISSEFEMRYRGLLQFYGDDLIAYKRKYPSNKHVNEFLRIISAFFTNGFEDNCPTSWKECQPLFWEELIYAAFPYLMKVTPSRKETKKFLSQLKKFVRWIDNRSGCDWYKVVDSLSREATAELLFCEELLNKLYLNTYPHFHDKDWNPIEGIEKLNANARNFNEKANSVFEVISVTDHLLSVEDIDSNDVYQIVDFPEKVKTGILLDGVIEKVPGDFYWTWNFTCGVYPQKARDYFNFVD